MLTITEINSILGSIDGVETGRGAGLIQLIKLKDEIEQRIKHMRKIRVFVATIVGESING
jgi:hypothetical protein